VLAYNGSVPGPTLEVNEGDRVIIHFENKLSVPTTVHWHGLHIPFDSDGSPFHPVQPGGKRIYSFTLKKGSAGTYWYHPHPNHSTGYQVAKGLYGAIIVRAPDDPLPRSIREKLIILSDNRFAADGSIDLPEQHSPGAHVDSENGREGDVLFVNGQVLPVVQMRSGEVQRWRIINASSSRVYRLSIHGQSMLHVGDDGGLFEKPVEVNEIKIATGERIEVLVRGTGKPGDRTTLQALPYDRYVFQTRPADWNKTRDLVAIEYSSLPAQAAVRIPSTLRAIPVLDTSEATVTRVVTLSQGLINGNVMDMNRVDFSAKLNATEIWQIENVVGMDHPFHLHGFQFQVIDRNGVPEPYRSWKDMVNIPKHETARIIVRYSDFPGKWMFHCHILDHEDQGMMGILEVK
jgi:bilirubin oxidase